MDAYALSSPFAESADEAPGIPCTTCNLGLGRHDSRLWGLYRRGEEIASGPDPEELLRDYLRSVGEAER
jgi:hypothetical protein